MTKQAIEAANRLADVLARENAALKRMDFHAAIALVPAKQAALAEMTRDGPPPPAASRFPGFQASAQRLRGLAEENRVLLERAITVQTRILGIVARAIAPVRQGPRYQRPNERRTPHRALAMAVSKRV
jgi:flagellar biosynthesis/type III secretory pathway chaperone